MTIARGTAAPVGPAVASARSISRPATLAPVPTGFRVALDPTTRHLDPHTLYGGAPARVLRLSSAGRAALDEVLSGPIRSVAAGVLARRLTDAGLAHPRPPRPDTVAATVVIPVRDRTVELDRCLTALGTRYPVLVVDDGSSDPSAVAAVASAHEARLLRREQNGGPAAARNTALAAVGTEIVVLLDSDCVASPDWIEQLAGHLADPLVAVAAPRVVPRVDDSAAGRYSAVRSCLDLGAREARVVPATRVAYLPTAALVVRRAALVDVALADGSAFDEALRYGEDVELIWRLHARGWRLRYDPSVEVGHQEPSNWSALLRRRFRYGTSAAPLARRHPDETVPLVLLPWPVLTVAAVLARRPLLVAAGVAGGAVATRRSLRRAGLQPTETVSTNGRMLAQTGLGIGRYLAQFGLPLVLGWVAADRRRLLRRFPLLALALSPAVHSWFTTRPALDPGRFVAAHLADDLAYGAGVWAGCIRHRSLRALRPVLLRRPARATGAPSPKRES